MARRGQRDRVAMVAILKIRAALEQPLEPALAEIRSEAHEIVRAELIDRDNDRELRRLRCRGVRRTNHRKEKESENDAMAGQFGQLHGYDWDARPTKT